MEPFAARYDRRSVVAVIYLLVGRGESVDVEPVSIQKICQLLAPFQIDGFSEPKLGTNLKKALNYFQRCETSCGVFEGCHILGDAGSSCLCGDRPDNTYDYVNLLKVVQFLRSIRLS